MRVNKASMLLAIIVCILCLSAGYVFGNSKSKHDINIFTDAKDTVTTREYTMDVFTEPTESVYKGSHITFKLSGSTVTKGIRTND